MRAEKENYESENLTISLNKVRFEHYAVKNPKQIQTIF